MIPVIVLLSVVVVAAGYLFFAPLYLEINTTEDLYRIRLGYLASVRLLPVKDSIILNVRIAGFTKQANILSVSDNEKPTQKRAIAHDKPKRKKINPRKIRALLRSFKINKCHVLIDTGNMQLNGILYLVCYLAGHYLKKNIRINFTGENELILEIENSLARMSWAYISSGN